MVDPTRLLALAGAGAFLLVSTSAFAIDGKVASARAQALQQLSANASTGRTAGHGAAPGEVYANDYRAYPPSCLENGVPFRNFPQSQNDPAPVQTTFVLPGDLTQCVGGGNMNECNYQETVTVTLWRIACSNNPSNGNGQSAVILELDRPAVRENNTALYPTFPTVVVTQNNKALQVRLAADPNTFFTTTYPNSPLYSSNAWVLENIYGSTIQFDYNLAFTLSLDNTLQFNVPAYNKSQYAAAVAPLPISGYMSSNWFDPLHGGEGMLTQVFDNNDHSTRTFTAAWYTFDGLNLPFWLFAQGTVNIGANTTGSVDTYYATGGTFAGGAAGGATFTKWGTMNFSFPDCNHMTFTFNGQTDQATNGPQGSGTRTWLRIANVNGLVCD